MLCFHAVKHPANIITEGFGSIGAGRVLETDFFDVSVQGAFFFGNFAERLNLLHKKRMHFAGDWFLLSQPQ